MRRFVLRGVDLSPVSFKALAAARQSSTMLWTFFSRIAEFRQIRMSEFARVMGAGYRILPLFDGSWAGLVRMRKCRSRWFRLWLLVHHPHSPGGLPWVWWLSAGRGFLVPPTAIGTLDSQLRLGWFRSLEGEGWTLSPSVDEDDFPEKEEFIKR